MNIVIINTYARKGGAATAAYRLYKALSTCYRERERERD